MSPRARRLLILVALSVATACARAPARHFYTLTYPIPTVRFESPFPYTVRVKDVTVRDTYRGNELVFRRDIHEIRYFRTENQEPVSIAFLLDLTGSMRHVGKLDEAKAAIQVFVDALHPEDRFGLVGFADEQVSWITDFTNERDNFLLRLSVQEGYGQTALFDALGATPRLVDERIGGRRAIVLITDGDDNLMAIFQGMAYRTGDPLPLD